MGFLFPIIERLATHFSHLNYQLVLHYEKQRAHSLLKALFWEVQFFLASFKIHAHFTDVVLVNADEMDMWEVKQLIKHTDSAKNEYTKILTSGH